MRLQKLFVVFLGLSTVTGIGPVAIATPVPTVAIKQTTRSGSEKIREAELKTMAADIESAIKNKNAAGILKYYAPFATSKLTVKVGSSTETFELDGLKEHTAYLEGAFKGIKDIEVLSNAMDVAILASDEMALIRRERTVNVTANDGKRYIIESSAVARVAPVDGKLKIVSLEETAEVSRRPN